MHIKFHLVHIEFHLVHMSFICTIFILIIYHYFLNGHFALFSV